MIKLNIANKFYLKLKKMKERKNRKESICWDLAPIFRFTTKISPFASTTFFFFLLLQWRFCESLWSLWINSTHSIGQIHPHYKAKTKQKCGGKTKSREKRGKTQKAQARMAVCAGRTAVRLPPQAVVGSTRSGLDLSWTLRFELLWTTGCALDLACFATLFTWLDSKSCLSPMNLARIMLICNRNSTKPKPSIIGEIHA